MRVLLIGAMALMLASCKKDRQQPLKLRAECDHCTVQWPGGSVQVVDTWTEDYIADEGTSVMLSACRVPAHVYHNTTSDTVELVLACGDTVLVPPDGFQDDDPFNAPLAVWVFVGGDPLAVAEDGTENLSCTDVCASLTYRVPED